jgi:hypothetical protein
VKSLHLKKWEKASKKDQKTCIDRATEACQVLCEVIAPEDGEKLFETVRSPSEDISEELHLLMIAHRDAPTRNLKTQILSIYAYRFPTKKLIELHKPYGNVTNCHIKRARAHATTVGPGEALHKETQHRVRIDKTKLDHFLEFVNRPYFYQDNLITGKQLLCQISFEQSLDQRSLASILDIVRKKIFRP